MSSLRGLVGMALLLLVVLAGAGLAFAAWGVDGEPLRTEPFDDPLLVDAVPTTADLAINTAVTLVAGEPSQFVSAAAGRVTRVDVAAGTTVAAGDVVVHVDDDPLVAFTGSAPLVRPLSAGSRGQDVERLQAFLGEVVDAPASIDGVFGASTAAAVRQLQADLAVRRTGRIGPADLIWIGDGPLGVADVAVAVGDVVAVDTPVLEGPADGAVARLPSALSREPLFAEARGGVVLRVPGAAEVAVDDQLQVAAADTAMLLDQFGEIEALPATVALVDPVEVVEVPSSAILNDPAGTCVVDDDGGVVAVQVVSAGFGRALLEPDGTVPAAVLVDPLTSRPDSTCAAARS